MSMLIFLIESGRVSHPLQENINRCQMRTQEHPQTRKNNLHYLNKILKTVASLFWSQTMSMPIFLIESGKSVTRYEETSTDVKCGPGTPSNAGKQFTLLE